MRKPNYYGGFMPFKIEDALRYGFAWIEDRESLKYILLNLAVQLATGAATILLLLMFFQQYLSLLFMGESTSAAFLPLALDWQEFISKVIMFFAFLIPILIISGVALAYVQALMVLFALRKKGLKPASFSFIKLIRLIIMGIAASLAALFYSFDKTFRIIQWLSLFGSIVSILLIRLLPLFIFLALPFLLIYIIIVIYNFLRLFITEPIFLHEELGIIETLKKSFEITQDEIWNVFLAALVLMVVSYILNQLPLELLKYTVLPMLSSQPTLALIVSSLVAILLAPIFAMFNAFYKVGVYTELLSLKKQSATAGI